MAKCRLASWFIVPKLKLTPSKALDGSSYPYVLIYATPIKNLWIRHLL